MLFIFILGAVNILSGYCSYNVLTPTRTASTCSRNPGRQSASLRKSKNSASKYSNLTLSLVSSKQSIFSLDIRQEEECPPGFPVQCDGETCCTAQQPICCGDGEHCCDPDTQVNAVLTVLKHAEVASAVLMAPNAARMAGVVTQVPPAVKKDAATSRMEHVAQTLLFVVFLEISVVMVRIFAVRRVKSVAVTDVALAVTNAAKELMLAAVLTDRVAPVVVARREPPAVVMIAVQTAIPAAREVTRVARLAHHAAIMVAATWAEVAALITFVVFQERPAAGKCVVLRVLNAAKEVIYAVRKMLLVAGRLAAPMEANVAVIGCLEDFECGQATGTCNSPPLPTMTLIYFPGLTDKMVNNVCLGMKKRGKGNTDILTYSGTGKPARRRAAGCVSGRCTGTPGTTCDEYPFASTQEGGAGAVSNCIPRDQNTDQGSYLKFWYLDHGFFPGVSDGKQFAVEVLGVNCADASLTRRDLPVVDLNGTQSTVLNGTTFDSSTGNNKTNRVILPVGDISAGNYSMSFSLPPNKSFASTYIIDNEGETFASVNASNSTNFSQTQTLTFNLDDDGIGLGMVLYTAEDNITVTWDYVGTPSPTSSTSHLRPATRKVVVVMFLLTLLSLVYI